MRAVRRAAASFAVAALCLGALPAGAGEQEGPPKSVMKRNGEVLQHGKRNSYCWTYSDGTGQCVDTIPMWPRHNVEVPADARVKLRIRFAEAPTEMSAYAWRRIDQHGGTVGEPELLSETPVPVVRDGATVAWELVVTLTGTRRYYIELFARWEGDGLRDAFWRFKTARSRNSECVTGSHYGGSMSQLPGLEGPKRAFCSRCRKNPENPKTGGNRWCKECRAAYRREWRRRNQEKSRDQIYEQSIRRRFGIDLSTYQAMLEAQQGRCAICGQEETARNKDGTLRRLQIDHDHETNQIRALLCHGCNHGMGGFRDDIPRIKAAIRYLEDWARKQGKA